MCVFAQDFRQEVLNGAGGPKLKNLACDCSAFQGVALEALPTDFRPPRAPKNLPPALCAGSMKLSVPNRNEAIIPMIPPIIPLAFQAYLVEGFLRSPIPRGRSKSGGPIRQAGCGNHQLEQRREASP